MIFFWIAVVLVLLGNVIDGACDDAAASCRCPHDDDEYIDDFDYRTGQ